MVSRTRGSRSQPFHGFGRWGCYLREDCAATGVPAGTLIGFCGLKHLDELNEVDIGDRFFPEHWGRGMGGSALSGGRQH